MLAAVPTRSTPYAPHFRMDAPNDPIKWSAEILRSYEPAAAVMAISGRGSRWFAAPPDSWEAVHDGEVESILERVFHCAGIWPTRSATDRSNDVRKASCVVVRVMPGSARTRSSTSCR